MNKKLFLILLTLISATIIGCNSGKTADSGESDLGSIFVSDENNTGSLEINLSSDEIPVAGTATFQVRVKDANGQDVNNVRVICDTENDLRIIEPSSGGFFTASFGAASGVIGCEDTGSFLFACGLGDGPAVRKTVLVKCVGARPIGFTGFPESFGGGLGNGVSDIGNDDDDDADGFTVRITDIAFSEANDDDTTSIDIEAIGDCDTNPDTVTSEPFTDTGVEFTVSNSTEQIVRFTSYSYVVNNFNGSGGVYSSPRLNLIGESLGKGATGSFSGLFADVGPTVGGYSKYFFGLSTPINAPGFKNIDFTLFGTLSDGRSVTVTASQAASFDSFNRCP